jgi:hypothetical protein
MPKQNHSARYEHEGRSDALEAYLLEHASGLRERDAAQHRAFIQIEGMRMCAIPIRHPTISLRLNDTRPIPFLTEFI